MNSSNETDLSKSSLEAAEEAAARVNAMLIAKGKLKPSQLAQTQQPKPKMGATSNLVIAEVEINDVPIGCRNKLTRGSTQDEISKMSGAAVSTRGRYIPPQDRDKNSSEKPLYLYIQGHSQEAVNMAVSRINQIIVLKWKPSRFSPGNVPNEPMPVSAPPPVITQQVPILPMNSQPTGLALVQEKLYIGLEHAPPSFDVKTKISGPGGSFLQHIQQETGAKITLRGKGSGFVDQTPGQETFEPMHIHIQHPNMMGLQQAKQLSENLILTVQQEYAQFQNALAAMPSPINPATATLIAGLHPQTSGGNAQLMPPPVLPPPPFSQPQHIPGQLVSQVGPQLVSAPVLQSSQVPVSLSLYPVTMGMSMPSSTILNPTVTTANPAGQTEHIVVGQVPQTVNPFEVQQISNPIPAPVPVPAPCPPPGQPVSVMGAQGLAPMQPGVHMVSQPTLLSAPGVPPPTLQAPLPPGSQLPPPGHQLPPPPPPPASQLSPSSQPYFAQIAFSSSQAVPASSLVTTSTTYSVANTAVVGVSISREEHIQEQKRRFSEEKPDDKVLAGLSMIKSEAETVTSNSKGIHLRPSSPCEQNQIQQVSNGTTDLEDRHDKDSHLIPLPSYPPGGSLKREGHAHESGRKKHKGADSESDCRDIALPPHRPNHTHTFRNFANKLQAHEQQQQQQTESEIVQNLDGLDPNQPISHPVPPSSIPIPYPPPQLAISFSEPPPPRVSEQTIITSAAPIPHFALPTSQHLITPSVPPHSAPQPQIVYTHTLVNQQGQPLQLTGVPPPPTAIAPPPPGQEIQLTEPSVQTVQIQQLHSVPSSQFANQPRPPHFVDISVPPPDRPPQYVEPVISHALPPPQYNEAIVSTAMPVPQQTEQTVTLPPREPQFGDPAISQPPQFLGHPVQPAFSSASYSLGAPPQTSQVTTFSAPPPPPSLSLPQYSVPPPGMPMWMHPS